MQYNLEERREDFSKVFIEAVEKTINLRPNFMIISGDIFNDPRPPNATLATVVRELRKLKEKGIPVLTVDGSHDSEPNTMTGTVLVPLHNAGLITYLPRMENATWQDENCYVYGLKSFRGIREANLKLPEYFQKNPPTPNPSMYNIFVFHGALDSAAPPYIEPDIRAAQIPQGFQYYAAGHIHEPSIFNFKTGKLVYPGCLETTVYTEWNVEKGFNYVKIEDKDNPPSIERIKIESARPFIVNEKNFTNLNPERITEESINIIQQIDGQKLILVLVLKGILPGGYKRNQVNIPKIRSAATKALYTLILNQIVEKETPRTTLVLKEKHSIRTAAYMVFSEIFKKKYGDQIGEKLAKTAVELLDPLIKDNDEKVKSLLDGAVTN
jgi:DNA repair exonuclease SbcCD nuclease subunit